MDNCKCFKICLGLLLSIVCLGVSIFLFVILFGYQGAKPATPCANTSFGKVTFLHRGNVNFAQENTLDAIYDGAALSGLNPEIDVRATQDGSAVLFHDESLLRLTGVDKNIADVTLDELLEITVQAEVNGYDYGFNNIITELLPAVKAICAVDGVSINFDVKTTDVIAPIISSLKESNCAASEQTILTTPYPSVASEAGKAFEDAGITNRIGMYFPRPGGGDYYFLGQRFMLKTRVLHTLLSGNTAPSIIEFHKSTYEAEKDDLIQKWVDDGWCVGVYGITSEEAEQYDTGVHVYIVDEGPVFPDLPLGGYGGDGDVYIGDATKVQEEVIYENGTDDSLVWYYVFIAVAVVLLLLGLLALYWTIRVCHPEINGG